ncbi:abortive phage infection protein [Mesobacillus boroniphilus]|uniref:Abortive phage infection protein n=1 Tax=Mesobacillus boroniphilus TaxID=308892 RepID=A0A944CK52_9BACI|nr:AIPR family protein [Mesobacillus boroniphilus]MBS8263851.1 abortive phage infection protein [Mesobacillus boroniphilus]
MNNGLLEFAENFQQQIISMAQLEGEESFREDLLTELFIDYLCDLSELDDGSICSYRGRGMQVNGFSFSEEINKMYLFVSGYLAYSPPETVRKSDVESAFKRSVNFLVKSLKGLHLSMEEASPAFDLALQMFEIKESLSKVEIIYLTDGLVRSNVYDEILINENITVTFQVWDIERLYRSWSSGKQREIIEVDLKKFGNSIKCLPMPEENPDYKTYLAIFPGQVLVNIYGEYGPRLLERNVRSFLQARGNVNKGIRNTIKNEPHMFLAYNNGLSAVAESLEYKAFDNGIIELCKIKDLQIVNGGQTTASIYNSYKKDNAHLAELYVQVKLTVINDPQKVDSIVPKISEYANNQNKIQGADFSANDPFHVKVESLSRTVWAPPVDGSQRQTKWFYERARGQYMDEKGRASTPGQKKQFESLNPKNQLFTKTDLAKYENTWNQLPHIVSRGAQKNFNEFTILINENSDKVNPDKKYFEDLIAKAILFKRTEKLVQEQKYGGYRANIVTYTIAWLSYKTNKKIDLSKIWREQGLSKGLEEAIITVSRNVHQHIIKAPGNGNITEWCKKEECWNIFKTGNIPLEDFNIELIGDKFNEGSTDDFVGDIINEISCVSAQTWFDIAAWSKESNKLLPWQRSLAFSLGRLNKQGKKPTEKQAIQGKRILTEIETMDYRIL